MAEIVVVNAFGGRHASPRLFTAVGAVVLASALLAASGCREDLYRLQRRWVRDTCDDINALGVNARSAREDASRKLAPPRSTVDTNPGEWRLAAKCSCNAALTLEAHALAEMEGLASLEFITDSKQQEIKKLAEELRSLGDVRGKHYPCSRLGVERSAASLASWGRRHDEIHRALKQKCDEIAAGINDRL